MKKLLILFYSVAISANAQLSETFSVGGDMFNGNYRAFGITAKVDVRYKQADRYDLSVTTTYRNSQQSKYGTSTLVKYEDDLYLTSNLTRAFGSSWKVIAFTENERSFQRSINLRSSVGLGIGIKLVKTDRVEVVVSEVMLPEYYWSSVNRIWNNLTVRASTRVRAEVSMGSAKFESVALFQPAVTSTRAVSFNDNLNWRLISTLDLPLAERASVRLMHTMSYEGYPYHINKAVNQLQQTASLMIKLSY